MGQTNEIIWVSDSFGTPSAHINKSNLNFERSLIGRLIWKREENHWLVIDKNDKELGIHSSLLRAKLALEKYYQDTK